MTTAWNALDRLAHLLYYPTALGRDDQGHQCPWHHRIHLIPATWLYTCCQHATR